MKKAQDNRPPDEQDPVLTDTMRDAQLFDAMIKTDAWKRYVQLIDKNGEAWLVSAAVSSNNRPHPEWVLGYLFALKVLTSKPLSVMREKDKEVADKERQLKANTEDLTEHGEPDRTHRPPQLV